LQGLREKSTWIWILPEEAPSLQGIKTTETVHQKFEIHFNSVLYRECRIVAAFYG
jgi:hypothetical protein